MIEVRRQRYFRQDQGRVWAALTQRAALQVWLGRTDLIPEVGRPFSLEIDGPFGQRLQVHGEVVAVEAPSRLVLRWRHGEVDTRLVVELETEGKGTRVVLRHRGFKGMMGMLLAALLAFRYGRALAELAGSRTPAWLVVGGALAGLAALLFAVIWVGGVDTPAEVVVLSRQPAPVVAVNYESSRIGETPSVHRVETPSVLRLEASLAGPVPTESLLGSNLDGGRDTTPDLDLTEPDELSELLASLAVRPAPVSLSEEEEAPELDFGEPVGTMSLAANAQPRAVHPLWATSAVDLWLESLVFDRLYEVVGNKASSSVVVADRVWRNRDGITLELRRDVHWHDGRRIRPEDVCSSWETFVDPRSESPHAERWSERIDSCEVIGREVHIALARPWKDPRLALDLPLLPQHQLEGEEVDFSSYHRFSVEPVGTGPFEAVRARRVVALRAADRPSRPSRIARINWVASIDPVMQVRDLALGTLDVLMGISGKHLPALKRANAALYPLSAQTLAIVYNSEEGPTADPDLRAALDGLLEGRAEPQEPIGIQVGIGPGFPDDLAREITNEWQAGGLIVQVNRMYGEGEFDVALLRVDLLANRHPLQAFVAPGPGNPFSIMPERVADVLADRGEEHIGTWLLVADILREEHRVKMLSARSSWLAVGPRVRVGKVSPSHPFDDFSSWRVVN